VAVGLADIVGERDETAAAAAVRALRHVDPLVMVATKQAVDATTSAEETKAFQGLWGKGAHAAAFAAVLAKHA
jgi:hypothetical protein